MTPIRALVSADRPVVRIWSPDEPRRYVELQLETQEAANAAVEHSMECFGTSPGWRSGMSE
jgi:hypothetical protein